MKKVLLLGINCRYTHTNLALRYQRSAILQHDFQVDLLELTINNSLREILEKIWQAKPNWLAISVYIWNGEIIGRLLPDLKKLLPNIKIILGGPEVSYNWKKWIDNFPEINHIICGNGESVLLDLLEGKTTEKMITAKPIKFAEIDFPYIEQDFSEIKNKYIYNESSRGCPFRCSYCLSSRSDQKLDFRPIDKVIQELDWLIDKKPKIIKFVDRTFNAKKSHYRKIWEYLIDLNPNTKFHFEVHPEFLDDEDFRILEKAPKDLFQIEVGIQSTNPQTIAAINRKDNWEISKKNILRLISLDKFHLHTDLIAGLPYEDFGSLAKSFDDIISLGADHFQMGFLKILPGTEMANKIDKFELIHTDYEPYEILKNRWLSFDEIIHLKQIEKLLDKIQNSGKFIFTSKFCYQIFDSAFEFYSQFSLWLVANGFDDRIKNWTKNAEQLLNFVTEYHPEHRVLLLDLLRYDWCITSASVFPVFLLSEKFKNLQIKSQAYLRQFNQSGIIKFKEFEISVKDIKRANYFHAETAVFYEFVSIEPKVWLYLEQKVLFGINPELIFFPTRN